MKNIEINIQLDPVEDGISWTPKKVKQEGKYALVIGTNGKYRLIDENEAVDILDPRRNKRGANSFIFCAQFTRRIMRRLNVV